MSMPLGGAAAHRIHAVVEDQDLTRQRAALVALLRRPGARWADITADLLERGDAVRSLRESVADEGLFPAADADTLIEEAADLIAGWMTEGIRFRTVLDADYPAQLRDIREVPPILYSSGADASDDRAIAVVGTRQASQNGRRLAADVATHLAQHKVTVVSGLAAGIDTARA